MDSAGMPFLPRADDSLDVDLREVDTAIEMVVRGAAVRVRLVGLAGADAIAPIALARAQLAGVDFRVDHTGATTRLTFGPSNSSTTTTAAAFARRCWVDKRAGRGGVLPPRRLTFTIGNY
jgi:hypothetical protein